MYHIGGEVAWNYLRQRFHWEWITESTLTQAFSLFDDHSFYVSIDAEGVPHEVQHGHRGRKLECTLSNMFGDMQWASTGVVRTDLKVVRHEIMDYFLFQPRTKCTSDTMVMKHRTAWCGM